MQKLPLHPPFRANESHQPVLGGPNLANCVRGFNRINQPEAISDRVAQAKSIHEFAREPPVPRCEGLNFGALKDVS